MTGMNMQFLEFERPIAELEAKIEELRLVGTDTKLNISEEIARLEVKSKELTESIFRNLTAWQITQLARHPLRPQSMNYIEGLFADFNELCGDRSFANDKAIVGGLAYLDDQAVMIIAQQKGRSTKEKISRNFGMPHPEGYRKALRLMKLAEKFDIPVITLIDTQGAYPGMGAEARGQSEAIARNLYVMSDLDVPVICVVIGEGCSGGALGIGIGDITLMLQYSYYATISPEGCASILFRSADKAPEAAEMMGITAPRLKELNLIDEIVQEPLGGAHRNPEEMMSSLGLVIRKHLQELKLSSVDELKAMRYEKLLAYGTDA